MNYVIKESKTVEEAIKEAILELNTTEDKVEIEVLEEASKGFFGLIGVKEAKVKVTRVHDPVEISDSLLKKIFESMDIKASNDIRKEEDVLYIDIKDIDSTNMGIIIGKRGSTLDAIQYLVSLAINKDTPDYVRVVIDIGGYRKKREITLQRLAKRMADKAIKNGRPVKLEPMNPYERRIIHFTLQNYKGIKTYSEGDEPYRGVVIKST